MPNVIRLGDPISHGGSVTDVSATYFTVSGVPVARVGDKIVCSIHGQGTIVEGSTTHTVHDIAVAYEGHKTSCGATLQATVSNFTEP